MVSKTAHVFVPQIVTTICLAMYNIHVVAYAKTVSYRIQKEMKRL